MSARTPVKAICGAVVCAVGCLAAAAAVNLPKGISSDDVLFYASYDKAADADEAEGEPKPVGKSKAVPGKVGEARVFIGSSGYKAEGNIAEEAGTVAFWFKPGWDPADKKHHSLFDWRGESHGHDRILFYKYANTNVIYFGLRSAKGSKATRKVSCTAPTKGWKPGEWRHIVGTWDAKVPEARLYVDGKPAGKTALKWEFGTMPKEFWVGSEGTTMDDLLILKRALTEAEAKALYAAY